MHNDDEASPSHILAGQAHLVRMLITLEMPGIFGSNFLYLCILSLSIHWYAHDDEASPSIILAGRTF